MNPCEIYCDTSCDPDYNICAWGCIIIAPSGKSQIYSGAYYNLCKPNIGELRAIVKALGKVKSWKCRKFMIYSDHIETVTILLKVFSKRKLLKGCLSDYGAVLNYLPNMRLSINFVPRNQNPAHQVAKHELKESRKKLKALKANALAENVVNDTPYPNHELPD